MQAGLESVKAVIGNEETSGLSDGTLRDALWEYYFDIERTIQWAIGIYSNICTLYNLFMIYRRTGTQAPRRGT